MDKTRLYITDKIYLFNRHIRPMEIPTESITQMKDRQNGQY